MWSDFKHVCVCTHVHWSTFAWNVVNITAPLLHQIVREINVLNGEVIANYFNSAWICSWAGDIVVWFTWLLKSLLSVVILVWLQVYSFCVNVLTSNEWNTLVWLHDFLIRRMCAHKRDDHNKHFTLYSILMFSTVQLMSKLTLVCGEHACVLQFLSWLESKHAYDMKWTARKSTFVYYTQAIFRALHTINYSCDAR